ncbi:MAG: hypothetical protein K2I30_02005 [Clostridia bacterium]|nr:hypothetical protein [Clostridia bacterium]
MKDFKSYNPPENQNPNPNANTADGNKSGANAPKASDINSTVELAKVLSRAMNGKSEGQLLHTIIAEAERGKREGTLSNTDLDNFYNALSPLLDGFKRKKLKEVITKLKSI